MDLKEHMKAVQSEIAEWNRKYEETRDNLSIEKSRVKELERDNALLNTKVSIFLILFKLVILLFLYVIWILFLHL